MIPVRRFKNKFALVVLLVAFTACQKITPPNENAGRILGSWSYRFNTGGFSGSGGSTKYSLGSWVEFTEKGCFKIYEGSKKESQKRYKIEMKKSIFDTAERPALVYQNGNYETYQISNDTLYLSEEAYDGFTYCFVRK